MYQLNSNQEDTRGRTRSLAFTTHHSNRPQNTPMEQINESEFQFEFGFVQRSIVQEQYEGD